MPKVYNSTLPLRNFYTKKYYLKKSDINIIETFEEFAPNVSGDIDLKIENTIYNIKNFTSSLDSLINLQEEIIQLNNLAENSDTELSRLLQEYGSDKKALQYDLIYSKIFKEIKDFTLLIEIGIGTNNEDILSNMSKFVNQALPSEPLGITYKQLKLLDWNTTRQSCLRKLELRPFTMTKMITSV